MLKENRIKLTEIILENIKLNDGSKVDYIYFKYPQSVAILANLNDSFLMVRQYRYAIKDYTWEIPAGSVNENESLINAAKRELFEETSYKATKLRKVISLHPSNAMSNEKINIFYTSHLKKIISDDHKREPIEKDMKIKAIPISELKQMITNGKITDASTLIALQTFFLGKNFN